MRLSQALFETLREDPAEAEAPSHKLLLRAGLIRRIGSGIYAYLPMMWRTIQKISVIVREEMDAAGAQECLLPQLQPADIWRESGRWETYTQAEGIMFTLIDRQERELGLGPTHEEVITAIARETIRSYRQLPQNLYQIQTKFRDEIRPRFGLLRGREFVMKDAYSFNADLDSLKQTYEAMAQAYANMLRRCHLRFSAVEADTGAIGGFDSQEFMVLADAGEDEVLYTEDGQYAANAEKAVSLPPEAVPSPFSAFEKVATPGTATIAAICDYLQCSPTVVVKNVLYEAYYDNNCMVPVLVSVRGDRDVNETKLQNELNRFAAQYGANQLLALAVPDADSQQKWASKPLPMGYIAPDISDSYIHPSENVTPQFLRLADKTATELQHFCTGANETGYHVVGANWGDRFALPAHVADLCQAAAGDRAPHDPNQTLQRASGIEVGHIFQLGTKYSQALGATYTSAQGEECPLYMGCYGIGISRLAQAAVEQFYDAEGLVWPVAIAPYEAIITVPNVSDSQQREAAEQLYQQCRQAGIETVLDDRDERAGVKFKDADLVGIPYRLVTGRSLQNGNVEAIKRATHQAHQIPFDAAAVTLKQWIEAARQAA
ncbi:MAG: proline--tRNA ligase [Cyanobacteria bacterium QS_8_64_29]|nr:MAG: proline--tRNA ligase [Cyanobacteria bacterium QS_8_64_29]